MRGWLAVLLFAGSAALASEPARVDRIKIFGNVLTRDFVVLRELGLKTGSPFSEDAIPGDKARLERLGLFRNVEINAVPDSSRNRYSLLVLLKEKRGWTLDPILVYDRLFGWIAGCAVVQKNVFGRRQNFRVGFKIGGVEQVYALGSDPWFGGPLRLFAELRASWMKFQYRYPDYESRFRLSSDEASAVLGRSFGRLEQIGVRVSAERVRTDDPAVTLSGTGRDDLVTLECFHRWDGRDRPEFALKGFFNEICRQWIRRPSGLQFIRTAFDLRWFMPVFSWSCLAFQAQAQISEGAVPVYKRIHTGGSGSLRGFETGSIAGENCWSASAEYRFPMILESDVFGSRRAGYFGVVFADVAEAWFSKKSPDGIPDYACAGFGFHFLWDEIVLRSECGFRSQGGLFVSSATSVKF
jgi:outer membrane protein insertion porin family